MEAPKVSVIIPVHNAGNRLRACINSLVSQTLKEIELIFVIDCPTDGSDKIVYEYLNQYENIIVVENEKNLNIGLSRNEGLKIAKGEYVAFCDHDDIVKEYMYEHMYSVGCNNDADIVLGVPLYSYEDSSKNKQYYYPQEGDVREILLPLVIGKDKSMKGWEFYFSHGVIWDNLYRRKMIESNQIKFIDNNIVTYEDNLFLIECLIHCNKAIVHNELVYIHTIDVSNTASTKSYNNPHKILAYLTYLKELLIADGVEKKYSANYINSVCSYIKTCYGRNLNLKNIKAFICLLNIIRDDPRIKPLIGDMRTKEYVQHSKNTFAKLYHGLIFQYLKR